MVVLIRDEERARLNEGWHIVRGSEPYVEKMLWGVVESYGDRMYVFIIERNGKEHVYRDYEKGVIFQTEREGWEALAQDMAGDIESLREDIRQTEKRIREEESALATFRAKHALSAMAAQEKGDYFG